MNVVARLGTRCRTCRSNRLGETRVHRLRSSRCARTSGTALTVWRDATTRASEFFGQVLETTAASARMVLRRWIPIVAKQLKGKRGHEWRNCKDCGARFKILQTQKAWLEHEGLGEMARCRKCRQFKKFSKLEGGVYVPLQEARLHLCMGKLGSYTKWEHCTDELSMWYCDQAQKIEYSALLSAAQSKLDFRIFRNKYLKKRRETYKLQERVLNKKDYVSCHVFQTTARRVGKNRVRGQFAEAAGDHEYLRIQRKRRAAMKPREIWNVRRRAARRLARVRRGGGPVAIPTDLKRLLASAPERKWERRRLEAYEIREALKYIGEDGSLPLPSVMDNLPPPPPLPTKRLMGGKNLLWLANAGARQ